MSKAERERRHHATLRGIERVQLIVGKGDRARVDHEGTLFERARMLMEEVSAHEATEAGLAAFDRLLRRAEEGDARHARELLAFIAAVWNREPLPLLALRGLDQPTGDDMLAVLDAFRHARLNLVEQVEGGPGRVARVLERRSLALQATHRA